MLVIDEKRFWGSRNFTIFLGQMENEKEKRDKMRMIQRKTVLLASIIMSLFIAFNTAFGAGIKLGPGPVAVLKAYKDGEFDKAREIMEKWKAKKTSFRTCDTREFKEVYRHLYDRKELKEGTYTSRDVETMLKNIQRIVDKNNCGK